ncbi:hypothetical protein BT93_H1970 [Corymbia citriodora subsp. variegata]|nr:hypothetical protein BT93_H1970 [Corymbia citriodora subsp. variegata]
MGESFPEDVLRDILSRLPTKSLVRCKCVNKRWRSLISDPDFLHRRIIVGGRHSPLETVDYEALAGGGEGGVVVPHTIQSLWDPRSVGSCDGLVCLICLCDFLIYNPTAREHRKLPFSDIHRYYDIYREYELFCGLGCDSPSDDYKIVEGILCENWEVAIFSLKSSSWRRIQVQLEERHLKVAGIKGIVVPLVYTRGGKIVFRMNEKQMILFNPEDNIWKEYPIWSKGFIRYAVYLETLVSPYLGGGPLRI